MSRMRAPLIGPIVGHTTDRTSRIWIRGKGPDDDGAKLSLNNRTIGVLTVLKDGQADPSDPSRTHYFRLRREFDRTGTFNLGTDVCFGVSSLPEDLTRLGHHAVPFQMEPDTQYVVRAGTLILDDVDDDEVVKSEDLLRKLPPASVWAEELAQLPPHESEAVVRTFPSATIDRLSFLLGSCRYPGLFFKAKKADAIFQPMLEQVRDEEQRIRFVLMVGDQIYADTLNSMVPLGRADTYEEFQDRYLEAFGSPNMRSLMRSAPHYMILDDHEIEDNWTQDRIHTADKRALFHLAIGAYMSYQWSHGPRTHGRRLYYRFDCGGSPFFVLDTRTERYRDDVLESLEDNHLLGRDSFDPSYSSQLAVLCKWLVEQQQSVGNRPKFIVTSSVFVPNDITTVKGDEHKNESDSWEAFPTTRRRILDTIVDNKVQNVVFLSGDIHCSCVAEIKFKGSKRAENLKAFAITSSAFYWPFPFADGSPAGYVQNSLKQGDSFKLSDKKIKMDYEAYSFTQDDNFCRVDMNWDKRELVVTAFGKDGQVLKKGDMETGQDLVTILKLAD